MNAESITRNEWEALGAGLVHLGEKIAAAFSAFADAFRRAFAWAYTDPDMRREILALFERSRYARGQRKPKPRGKRNKRESRETWRTFHEMQRARRRGENGQHGAVLISWTEARA